MAAGHQWKHGWIPLTEAAAKEKFHGDIPKGWKPSAPHAAPEDHAHNLSKDAFNMGDSSHGALNVHREAAAAHRRASSLTSSADESRHHSEMAKLHSRVASGKMYSRAAEDKADAMKASSHEQTFRDMVAGQGRGKSYGRKPAGNDAKQRQQATRLASMASDSDISYTPTGKVRKSDGVVWHSMTAKSKDGRTWEYWLAPDSGSYRGSFGG